MSKILITGGAGFIGVHLAKSLAGEDHEIDLLDNFSRGVRDRELALLSEKPNVRLLDRDLRELDALDGLGREYRFIYHLAAIVGVAHVMDRPYAVLRDNFTMAEYALRLAASQTQCERFIFTSSSEVYAGTLQHFNLQIPTPETSPLAMSDLSHPRSAYMLSKILGEALCRYSEAPYTIVRLHNIYGPRMGMSHVIPEVMIRVDQTKQGGSLDIFSAQHRRAFCYIEDAIRMMRLAAESPQGKNRTLNIGNQDCEITVRELVEKLVRIAGKDLRIVERGVTPGSVTRRCPDMTEAIALTGYRPQVGLEQGLRLTLDWYREHVFNGRELTAK